MTAPAGAPRVTTNEVVISTVPGLQPLTGLQPSADLFVLSAPSVAASATYCALNNAAASQNLAPLLAMGV